MRAFLSQQAYKASAGPSQRQKATRSSRKVMCWSGPVPGPFFFPFISAILTVFWAGTLEHDHCAHPVSKGLAVTKSSKKQRKIKMAAVPRCWFLFCRLSSSTQAQREIYEVFSLKRDFRFWVCLSSFLFNIFHTMGCSRENQNGGIRFHFTTFCKVMYLNSEK